MIVWEISLGAVITLLTVLFAAAGFYWKQNYDAKEIKSDIKDIKEDIKILNKLIIESAILTKDVIYLKDRIDLLNVDLIRFWNIWRKQGHGLD